MADPEYVPPKARRATRDKTVKAGDVSLPETTGPLSPPPKKSLAEMREGAVKAAMPPEEGPPAPPAEPDLDLASVPVNAAGMIEIPVSAMPDAKEGDIVGPFAVDRI